MNMDVYDADVAEPDGTEHLLHAEVDVVPRRGETLWVESVRLGGRRLPHRVEEVHWSTHPHHADRRLPGTVYAEVHVRVTDHD